MEKQANKERMCADDTLRSASLPRPPESSERTQRGTRLQSGASHLPRGAVSPTTASSAWGKHFGGTTWKWRTRFPQPGSPSPCHFPSPFHTKCSHRMLGKEWACPIRPVLAHSRDIIHINRPKRRMLKISWVGPAKMNMFSPGCSGKERVQVRAAEGASVGHAGSHRLAQGPGRGQPCGVWIGGGEPRQVSGARVVWGHRF